MVEFFPAGNAKALAEKMNLALASPQEWGYCKVANASRLGPFREEYVAERYLREYAPQKTDR
jgi:hypothetical protein